MDRDTLVPWLTFVGLIVTSLISPFVLKHMEGFRQQRAAEDTEVDRLRNQRDALWLEYMKLRELFTKAVDRNVRILQRVLYALEGDKDEAGYDALHEHVKALEAFELPPVPDLDDDKPRKTDRQAR